MAAGKDQRGSDDEHRRPEQDPGGLSGGEAAKGRGTASDGEEPPEDLRTTARPVPNRFGDVADRPDDVHAADLEARQDDRHDRDREPDRHPPADALPLEREAERQPELLVAAVEDARREAHDDAAEAEADERPGDRRSDRVAPALCGERADERRAAQPNGAQHPQLRAAFVGQHHEDVDEQEDPRENGEPAQHREELHELGARLVCVLQQVGLDRDDVRGQVAELLLQRCLHRIAGGQRRR